MEVSLIALQKSCIDSDLLQCLSVAYQQIIPDAAASIIRQNTKLPETRLDPILGMYFVNKEKQRK